MSSRRIHVLIKSDPPRRETIEFSPSASPAELKSVLVAAAEVGDLVGSTTVIKVSTPDGALVPASVEGLRPNGEMDEERYVLEVKQDRMLKYEELSQLLTPAQLAHTPDVANLHQIINKLSGELEALSLAAHAQPSRTPSKAVKRVTKIDPRYSSQPRYVFSDETRSQLKAPTFDPWQWEETEMLALLELMFFDLGAVEEFKIDVPILRRFLQSIKDGYNLNHFHNFRHCFCVCQMMYAIVNTTNVVEKLTAADKLILLIACIGHDLDHPGYNNAYQINARTDLAIIYNDQSPLEMHHAAVLFTILKDPATNILANMSETQYRDIRKGIIRCILATDMAKHGEILAQFRKYADEGFKFEDPAQKDILLQMITKCADVSNEVRPPDVAEPWVDCLLEEFFEQTDREKAEGLPFAPFMDRDKVTKASAQVGFIGFVLVPLYELVARVLPNMDPIITPVKQAWAYYKDLQETEKAAAANASAAK